MLGLFVFARPAFFPVLKEFQEDVQDWISRRIELDHGVSLVRRLEGSAGSRYEEASANFVGRSGDHDGPIATKVVRINFVVNVAVAQLLIQRRSHRTASAGDTQFFRLCDDPSGETEFCSNGNVVQAFDAIRIPKVLHYLSSRIK